MDMMKARGAEVPLPVDVVVADEVSALARANKIRWTKWPHTTVILDVGPKTAARLADIIAQAGTIIWNGPVGVVRTRSVCRWHQDDVVSDCHTRMLSRLLAAVTRWPRLPNSKIADDVGYISTGGGAFLEFLEGKTLPAIEALEARANG